MKLQGEATLTFLEGGMEIGYVRKYLCGCTDSGQSHSGYFPHLAYFCTECGKVWMRGEWTYSFDYRPLPVGRWRVLERPCPAHGGGQLIEPSERLDAFSAELLLREFHILLHYYRGTEHVERESKESV